ncbi:MAG: hypothetical protein ACFFCI_17185 [Promethearchaeota archaeon]
MNAEDFEIDCYLKILNYFQSEHRDREKTEIWKNKAFIKLMEFLDQKKNKTFVANAIILILSLFEDIPPDIYNNRGVNVNRISAKDRQLVIADLKEEFLPN